MPLRLMASGIAVAALAVAMSMPAFAQQSPEAGAAPAQAPSSEPAAAPPPPPAAAPPPPPAGGRPPAPSVAAPPKTSAPHRRVAAGAARVRASVNLRKGPGESYEILTLIPAGSALTVRSCTGEWCAVHWQGNEGYAIARNLDMGARQAAYGPPGAVPPGYPPEGPPPPGYHYGPPVYAGPPAYYGPPPYYYYRPYWGWGWGWGWRRW